MSAALIFLAAVLVPVYVVVTIGVFLGNALFWWDDRNSRYPRDLHDPARAAVRAPLWPVTAARALAGFVRVLPALFKDARP